jgi:RNA polymerase sigma factor (sigma-70 family)
VGDADWPVEGLVAAAQDGHAVAIAALVSSSHPHVQRFAHSLCASPQDAEDAAQEALIVLYQKIGTLRTAGALGSWLFRIVRNECLRRSRQVARRVPVPAAEGLVGSAEDAVLARLEAQRVAEAVAALPDDQRRVLIMRDVLGYPGHAVADAMGLSTAAMKSRLHRARTTVRVELQESPR